MFRIIFIQELIKPMGLRFFNTLTKKKELFVPENNAVRWYICGPTVYDSPHIGHARTYVCFDAVRRVLEGYFGFNVLYVMNITDVDDKIINKARESLSFDKKLQNIEITKNSNLKSNKNECDLAEFAKRCAEITRKYELEFFNDLQQLCVQPPTFVTRVSEYMDVINDFIKNLVHKEMAYTSNGSVYFDIEAYRRKFTYPQFVDKSAVCDEENPAPLNSHEANATSFHQQSEISRKDSHPFPQNNDNATSNEISRKDAHPFPQNNDNAIVNEISRKYSHPSPQNTPIINEQKPNVDSELQKTDKRSPIDFALWKSRNTDLYYKSPFGNGRPGWHIECSAMAHSIFQKGMDIHSGGIDLAFPHHENEMAQSQAITETKWVKTWLHTGHLHIDGLKMSKSLKNFITIRDFLKKYTPRQIRLAFLIQQWWKPMVFSDLFMKNAVNTEKKLFTFLSNLQSRVSMEYVQNCCFDKKSQKHLQTLESFKQKVHESFCDNVDTCGVLKVLQELGSYYYAEEQSIPVFLIKPIFEFVKRILDLLGLFSIESENTSGNNEVLLDILNSYRNEIRDLCKKKADYKAFYTASDSVRDKLKKHNIVMEDTKNNTSSIRKIN